MSLEYRQQQQQLAQADTLKIDVDDLLNEIDAERNNAAAVIQAHRKRKLTMENNAAMSDQATKIQARFRGKQSRDAAKAERSLGGRARRASRQLLGLVMPSVANEWMGGQRATASEARKPTETTPAMTLAAFEATPATRPLPPQEPATTPTLQTLPLNTPTTVSPPAAPPSRAPRREIVPFCPCLARGRVAGDHRWNALDAPGGAFDMPVLSRLLGALMRGDLPQTPRDAAALLSARELELRTRTIMSPTFYAPSPAGNGDSSKRSAPSSARLSVGAAA